MSGSCLLLNLFLVLVFKKRKTFVFLSVFKSYKDIIQEGPEVSFQLTCPVPFILVSSSHFSFFLKSLLHCVQGSLETHTCCLLTLLQLVFCTVDTSCWAQTRLGGNMCEYLSFVLLLARELDMCSRQDFQLECLKETSRLEKLCLPLLPAGLGVA